MKNRLFAGVLGLAVILTSFNYIVFSEQEKNFDSEQKEGLLLVENNVNKKEENNRKKEENNRKKEAVDTSKKNTENTLDVYIEDTLDENFENDSENDIEENADNDSEKISESVTETTTESITEVTTESVTEVTTKSVTKVTTESISNSTSVHEIINWEKGRLSNVDFTLNNAITISKVSKPYRYMWVALSDKGTVVKFDTKTKTPVGEYYTAPGKINLRPSRTTVDKMGSVWIANTEDNSVTRICTPESGLWIDKNGNGVCDTSAGLGDVLKWKDNETNDISLAEDECIINFIKVSSKGTRHISVTSNNDVWVSGANIPIFDLIDTNTGKIKRTEGSVLYGGYGGFVDANNVLWSSGNFLRWDTSKPLDGPQGENWIGSSHDSYYLMPDSSGNVWETTFQGNIIRKYNSEAKEVSNFKHGAKTAQGAVVGLNGDIWVSHGLKGDKTVGHLKPDGTFVGNVIIPDVSTGLAVDDEGYIWAVGYGDKKLIRINPNLGSIGNDGQTLIGQVDFTSNSLRGELYNYSDMTGSFFYDEPLQGVWSTVFDSGMEVINWRNLDWDEFIPEGSNVQVSVATSMDGINFNGISRIIKGNELEIENSRFLKIFVTLKRADKGEAPIISNLRVKGEQPKYLDEIADQTVSVGQNLSYKLKLVRKNLLPLKYIAEELPEGSILEKNGQFSWKPNTQQVGEHFIQLGVKIGDMIEVQEVKITVVNRNLPPNIKNAYPSTKSLWPLDHRLADVEIKGIVDPEGDQVMIAVLRIMSNEKSKEACTHGRYYSPDAYGIYDSSVRLRAEAGSKGEGRVYKIYFVAIDSKGAQSFGNVYVTVPTKENDKVEIVSTPYTIAY
jgi:streptogramin lyase